MVIHGRYVINFDFPSSKSASAVEDYVHRIGPRCVLLPSVPTTAAAAQPLHVAPLCYAACGPWRRVFVTATVPPCRLAPRHTFAICGALGVYWYIILGWSFWAAFCVPYDALYVIHV